jgi:ornithine--oxo-acid transaminase
MLGSHPQARATLNKASLKRVTVAKVLGNRPTEQIVSTQKYVQLEERYGAHNYNPLNVVITRGAGVWVWDVDGKRYLDCLSAYSAVNQGHCHPRIIRALTDQASRLTLTSRAFRTDQLGLFYKEVSDLTGYARILPMNSGAEAVETAIKAARKWGYVVKGVPQDQAQIIVCQGNFHGRTTTIISFSTQAKYRKDFGPFTPGFITIPYGDADALAATLEQHGEKVVAFLFEPIQGEGGINIPPDGYLQHAEQLCRQHNVLMMADEIQTGLGRTGRLFAFQHEDIKPDVTVIGKALSGGFYPISAVLSQDEVLGLFQPGDHGSTFGGNPLGCAVARSALKVLVEENLIERSAVQGGYLLDNLCTIDSPHVKEVRGRGLLVGVELKPEAGGARRFCEALAERGMLCKDTHQNVIRLAPPLVIDRPELDWAVEQLRVVLTEK